MSKGGQFGLLLSAHLKSMFREKQVWFWNIFFPIILMSLFMIIFGGGGDGSFKAKVALVKPAEMESSAAIEQGLKQIPVLEWKSETPVSREQADEWIKNEDVDAVIVLPSSEDKKTVELIVNTENEMSSTSQALSGILNNVVQQANVAAAGGGAEPEFSLAVSSVTSGSEDLEYVDFLLTGMIALSIAQGGLFGMVDMVEMRRNGLLKRLRMTPVRMGLFGMASMTVRFILGVVQMLILAAIGVFGFGANLHIDFVTLLVAFLVGALAFNALGYLFSSFSKTLESYMGLANIASFLMMFISGIFFATSSLPEWLQPLTRILPLTYFVDGIRDGLVYGEGIATGEFWLGIGILVLWGAATFALGSIIYRKSNLTAR